MAEFLEEAHQPELDAAHHGDARRRGPAPGVCSYCAALKRAARVIAQEVPEAGMKPLECPCGNSNLISRLRSRVLDLAKERSDLETRLIMHEQFIKGSLVELRTRCGKPNCRCRKSKRQRHGPRLYLSVSRDGKQRMVYVPKAMMEQTRKLVEQARSYRSARKKWLEINERLWRIFMEMERLKTRPLHHEPKKKGR